MLIVLGLVQIPAIRRGSHSQPESRPVKNYDKWVATWPAHTGLAPCSRIEDRFPKSRTPCKHSRWHDISQVSTFPATTTTATSISLSLILVPSSTSSKLTPRIGARQSRSVLSL